MDEEPAVSRDDQGPREHREFAMDFLSHGFFAMFLMGNLSPWGFPHGFFLIPDIGPRGRKIKDLGTMDVQSMF